MKEVNKKIMKNWKYEGKGIYRDKKNGLWLLNNKRGEAYKITRNEANNLTEDLAAEICEEARLNERVGLGLIGYLLG